MDLWGEESINSTQDKHDDGLKYLKCFRKEFGLILIPFRILISVGRMTSDHMTRANGHMREDTGQLPTNRSQHLLGGEPICAVGKGDLVWELNVIQCQRASSQGAHISTDYLGQWERLGVKHSYVKLQGNLNSAHLVAIVGDGKVEVCPEEGLVMVGEKGALLQVPDEASDR